MRSRFFVTALLFVGILALTASMARAGERLRISAREISDPAEFAVVGPGGALDTKRGRLLVFGQGIDPEANRLGPAVLMALSLRDNTWTALKTTGAASRGLGHPGLTYVASEDALYLFGGWPSGDPAPLAELWRLNLSQEPLQWTQLPMSPEWPPARNGMVFVADEPRGRLLLHGGDGGPHPKYGFTPLDDLWAFDLKGQSWSRVAAQGDAPAPRWNHSAAIDPAGGKLYVYGGAGYVLSPAPKQVADTNVHTLDLTTNVWSRSPDMDRSPRPVEGTSLTYDSEADALVLVGGLALDKQGTPGISRVYCFDLKRKKWVRTKEILDKKRRDHVGVYDPDGKRHVIFGGQSVVEEGNFYKPGIPFADAVDVIVKRTQSD
ncbi:MAG TPA: kelch repeat-containing protein [Phycisphaerae bacterium]|nr:kelch repeat-containing protein [Phycisphaerae bacterium]HRW52310.1 kelch repeat-containing protein [Phycisphaerae bacterium]